MPYVLKPNKLFAKDPNGDGYLPQNIVADRATADIVSEVTEAGEAQKSAISSAGTTQTNKVKNAGTAQVNAINAKASELNEALAEADSMIEDIGALGDILNGFRALLDLVHPVGSIYMSTDSTNPGELFGGTWTPIEDTFLLAAGSTYAAGSTGGEATHTLLEAEMPLHFHYPIGSQDAERDGLCFQLLKSIPTISGSWLFHRETSNVDYVVNAIKVEYDNTKNPPEMIHGYNDTALMGSTGNAGGSQPHNNMPPYKAVYVWERTA